MQNLQREIDRLYKVHFGKLVASLHSFSKSIGLETVEDLVQDAFVSALTNWKDEGIPSNPAGWIFAVAKNKALNWIRKEKRKEPETDSEFLMIDEYPADESIIRDQQLKLLFACAHPDLSPKVQVVITLKYVVNFKVEAIAKVLGMSIDGIDKLLVRSRQKIKSEKILLDEPELFRLRNRLPIVHKIIYLLFNEGYKSSTGKNILNEELCEEALLLNKYLIDNNLGDETTFALQALMLFNAARFKSRFGNDGGLLDLEEQDRNTWNRQLIRLGIDLLERSTNEIKSSYHYEASIACLHCSAPTFASTNWNLISTLYLRLLEISANPFVELNYAIALFYAGERSSALQLLNALHEKAFLNQYFLLNVTLGKFYLSEGKKPEAQKFLQKAKALTSFKVEKDYIDKLIGKVKL